MIDVRVQAGDFDAGRQLKRFADLCTGAVASFTGRVMAGDEVASIHIDHYPAIAREVLAEAAEEAERLFSTLGIILIHRHGSLQPGDQALFVGVAATDPDAAQEACRFLVDALRTRAPFWRKELLEDGTARWR